MIKHLKLHSQSDAKNTLAQLAIIAAPIPIRIILKYELLNSKSNLYHKYKEEYVVYSGINMWNINYLTYTPSMEDLKIHSDLTQALDNTSHIKLYFGKDVTNKTNKEVFQLLYTTNINPYTYKIDCFIIYDESYESDIIFTYTSGGNYNEDQYIKSRKYFIDEEKIIPEVNDLHNGNECSIILDNDHALEFSYSKYGGARVISLIINRVNYEIDIEPVTIVFNSVTKKLTVFGTSILNYITVAHNNNNIYLYSTTPIVVNFASYYKYPNIILKDKIPTGITECLKSNITSFNKENGNPTYITPIVKIADKHKLGFVISPNTIVDINGNDIDLNLIGTTEERPAYSRQVGYQYYDTTLNKPIWWNGSAWIDATGATV